MSPTDSAPRAPDCGRRNRAGVPCYQPAGHPPTQRHLGTEAGGGSVSWGDDEPEGLPPDEAARRWLASPDELAELCQGDSAAVRGARVVLALVARGELGAPVERPEGWTGSGGLDRLGAVAVVAGEEGAPLQAPDGAIQCTACGSLLTAGAGPMPQRPLDAARSLAQRCATGDEVRAVMGWLNATRSEMGAIAAVMDAVGARAAAAAKETT